MDDPRFPSIDGGNAERSRRTKLVSVRERVVDVAQVVADSRGEIAVIKIPLRVEERDAVGRGAAERRHVFVRQPTLANLDAVHIAIGALVVVPVAEQEHLRRQPKP